MCGRYTLLANQEEIRKYFSIENDWKTYTQSYNIAPSEQVLVIIYDGKINRAGYMQWGLVPFWAKDKKRGHSLMNARTETIDVKPSFKHLIERKRCLIVADSFYEWKTDDTGKVPHRIQLKDKSLFGFAGLWDKWEGEGEQLYTCTMLTKDANDFMQPIHHRMPIIFEKEASHFWLQHPFPTNREAKAFALQSGDPSLISYPVSDYVNNARNKDSLCIEHV